MHIVRHFLSIIVIAAMLAAGALFLVAAIHPDPRSHLGWLSTGPLQPVGEAIFGWTDSLPRTLPYLEYLGIGLLVIGGICLGHYIACQLLRPQPIERTPDGLPDPDAKRPGIGVPAWLVTLVAIGLLGYGGKLYGDYRLAMAADFGARKVVAEAAAQFEAVTEAEPAESTASGGTPPTPQPRRQAAPTAEQGPAPTGFQPTEESFAAARQPVLALSAFTLLGGFVFGFSIGQRRMRYAMAMGDGSLADVEAAEKLARQAETGKGMENYASHVPGLNFGNSDGGYNARERRAEIIRKLEARMPEEGARKRRRGRATA